jgi:putative ABC transport system permease protein
MSSLVDGTLFNMPGQTTGKSYPRVTLDMDPAAPYEPVKDSVEAMGFRSFSFAAQFDQMRKAFVYLDMALGLIGLIALVTASLGIVNTLVMSILERRKEIGVLKSLGADERDIRRLFLVESAVIGSVGAIVGITFGWIITRIASAIAKAMMAREGVTGVELFALPWWLILIAFSFGLIVSLVAGLYPAARAARVDPVEALRNE